MRKSLFLLLLLACLGINETQAQFTKYIVRLKDKGTNPFAINNPAQYLSARAIAKRTRYNIPIDSADLPITPRYIDSIRLAGAVTILNHSKWLNQVAIQTTDAAALAKINSFPFVLGTSGIAAREATVPVNKQLDAPADGSNIVEPQPQSGTAGDHYSYGVSYNQVHLNNADFLHNRGFRGQGMNMAIMDAGFFHYLSLPTFDSVRNNGQILSTWDFVAGNASVDEDDSHGKNCFSIIAANMPGTFVGTAPKTSFHLYRTEDVFSEYKIEEQNWVAAAERADSLGVDVCSVSLGYYNFDNASLNYTYADMNGNTTIIARGADMAAKKGMLVTVAAGNEGSSPWHYIISPADGDSVLAVGAVNNSGQVGSFSSYGPTSDGQIKPNVSAVGVGAVIANNSNGQPTFSNGTSYACPNMAGMVTCLWQAFPEVNNMTIINTIQQAATKANNPDDRVGYGIPDMKNAYVRLVRQLFTKNFTQGACKTNLQWSVKTDSAIKLFVERKLSTGNYSTLSTINSTGAFALNSFTYEDDMNALPTGAYTYRLRMDVAADTSFYLDSVTVNFTAKPALGADKNQVICVSNPLDLTTQFNTTGLTATYTIGGNPVPAPNAVNVSGTYRIVASNTSGCSDTALVNLTVTPLPCGVVPPNPTVFGDTTTIGPNPVRNNLTVRIERNTAVTGTILVTTTSGQKIYTRNFQQPAGNNFYTIPMNGMAKGIYFVTVRVNDKKVFTRKIVKD